MKFFTFLILLLVATSSAGAQHSSPRYSNLSRNITIRMINQPLENVLDRISETGRFYFSYSGNTFKKDSIVSLIVQDKTIRYVLDQLFQGQVEYKEASNYIILRSINGRFDVLPENIRSKKNVYEIEGYVIDQKTGRRVKEASVYEKHLLKSTLTDENGYFKLRFKGERDGVVLTVSKDNFRDTSIRYLANINISPQGFNEESSNEGVLSIVEKIRISRFLLSSRQRIQSLNIPGFLANSPFQASLFPGLSSHGMLSSQVVNKGSLNVFGGYTAGVDGAEVAGFFNINKQDVKKFQAAGMFNIVGGSVKGMQVAGILNIVLDSVGGFQAAGLMNNVRAKTRGFQAAGLINRVQRDFNGAQFAGLINLNWETTTAVQSAGLINFVRKNFYGTQFSGLLNLNAESTEGTQTAGLLNLTAVSMKGVQIAGLTNISMQAVKGTQVAGLFNFANRLNGTQVGLFNYADTSSGCSIGLINIVRKGYHKIGLSSNELTNANFSLKTGNSKLYTIFLAGANLSHNEKLITGGLGLGHDFLSSRKLSLALEGNSQLVYQGDWENVNLLHKLQTNLQLKLSKYFSLFSGPAYSLLQLQTTPQVKTGYKEQVAPGNARAIFKNAKGWLGWNVGITVF